MRKHLHHLNSNINEWLSEIESGNKMLRMEKIHEYYQNTLSFKSFKVPAYLDRM